MERKKINSKVVILLWLWARQQVLHTFNSLYLNRHGVLSLLWFNFADVCGFVRRPCNAVVFLRFHLLRSWQRTSAAAARPEKKELQTSTVKQLATLKLIECSTWMLEKQNWHSCHANTQSATHSLSEHTHSDRRRRRRVEVWEPQQEVCDGWTGVGGGGGDDRDKRHFSLSVTLSRLQVEEVEPETISC